MCVVVTSLQKMDSPSPQAVVGFHAHLPTSVLGFCLAPARSGLLDAVTVTVFISAAAPLYLIHTVSLRSATTSGSYNLSHPSSEKILSLEGRGVAYMPHLGLSIPQSHVLCRSTS